MIGDKGVYKSFYDKNKVIYVHIPKTAGTSICQALYAGDPWHFSCNELKLIHPIKFKKYQKVAFVRDPLERLLSTYHYSITHIKENPNTSISFMKECKNFDDFLENFLTKELVNEHYFFWKQVSYVNCDMDFIGKFENIENDFSNMCSKLGVKGVLEHKNKSLNFNTKTLVKKENIDKVFSLYGDDYERFNYSKKLSLKLTLIN
ncbi:sulfotransferase family 2 domain-containing protein [Psychromonas sp. PT13]|uniref:sulfotransferase family 2 domain-containing protein n=1 Tax=Psychromonas sp. PT13 TaxID=3439547 RepID=UPI003EBF042C